MYCSRIRGDPTSRNRAGGFAHLAAGRNHGTHDNDDYNYDHDARRAGPSRRS